MNEAEKKAFAALSEEEQKEVAGGETIDGRTLLTQEQCQKLKEMFKKKPLLEEDPTEKPHKIPTFYSPYVALGYGGPSPSPIYVPHQPFTKHKPSRDQEQIDTIDQNGIEN